MVGRVVATLRGDEPWTNLAWLKAQGLVSVKDLWCKNPPGYTSYSFVERADLLNRPLRTHMVGGVRAGG